MRDARHASHSIDSVVSAGPLSAAPSRVWSALAFYEQLPGMPSWLLRVVLPVPVRTDRRAWEAGVETRCVYDRGFIVKRLTRVERPHRCEFDVVQQRLDLRGGIRLVAGRYELTGRAGGTTQLELETLYVGSARPRWFWRRVEAAVCRSFHRHILESIRLQLRGDSRGGEALAGTPVTPSGTPEPPRTAEARPRAR